MSARLLENPRTWIATGILLTVALFAASPYDLVISQNLAHLDSRLGQFIKIYGTMPFIPLYLLCLVLLLVPSFRKSFHALSVAASALIVQALGHTWIVTSLFKWLWGRTRFYHLNPDYSNYMSIFDFDTGGAGVSFTSGHVATALVTLPIVMALARYGKVRAARIVLVCNVTWGAFMAYARILAGAHYATDVLGSAALACFFVPVSVYLGERYFRLFDKTPEDRTKTTDSE